MAQVPETNSRGSSLPVAQGASSSAQQPQSGGFLGTLSSVGSATMNFFKGTASMAQKAYGGAKRQWFSSNEEMFRHDLPALKEHFKPNSYIPMRKKISSDTYIPRIVKIKDTYFHLPEQRDNARALLQTLDARNPSNVETIAVTCTSRDSLPIYLRSERLIYPKFFQEIDRATRTLLQNQEGLVRIFQRFPKTTSETIQKTFQHQVRSEIIVIDNPDKRSPIPLATVQPHTIRIDDKNGLEASNRTYDLSNPEDLARYNAFINDENNQDEDFEIQVVDWDVRIYEKGSLSRLEDAEFCKLLELSKPNYVSFYLGNFYEYRLTLPTQIANWNIPSSDAESASSSDEEDEVVVTVPIIKEKKRVHWPEDIATIVVGSGGEASGVAVEEEDPLTSSSDDESDVDDASEDGDVEVPEEVPVLPAPPEGDVVEVALPGVDDPHRVEEERDDPLPPAREDGGDPLLSPITDPRVGEPFFDAEEGDAGGAALPPREEGEDVPPLVENDAASTGASGAAVPPDAAPVPPSGEDARPLGGDNPLNNKNITPINRGQASSGIKGDSWSSVYKAFYAERRFLTVISWVVTIGLLFIPMALLWVGAKLRDRCFKV